MLQVIEWVWIAGHKVHVTSTWSASLYIALTASRPEVVRESGGVLLVR